MFLAVAAALLVPGTPSMGSRVVGLVAALASGLSLGVVLALVGWRRMIRRHMDVDHPGGASPSEATSVVPRNSRCSLALLPM